MCQFGVGPAGRQLPLSVGSELSAEAIYPLTSAQQYTNQKTRLINTQSQARLHPTDPYGATAKEITPAAKGNPPLPNPVANQPFRHHGHTSPAATSAPASPDEKLAQQPPRETSGGPAPPTAHAPSTHGHYKQAGQSTQRPTPKLNFKAIQNKNARQHSC